jgi:mannosyltransferase OCH1-like enzyme
VSEIPKRFMRIWLGRAERDPRFDQWWFQLYELHPDWDFRTLRDDDAPVILKGLGLDAIYADCENYAARSDVLRYAALFKRGGIYVDTDVMPLRSFDPLVDDTDQPFAARRSSKSFESAVIGSPAEHPALADLIVAFPDWYRKNEGRAASVRTGPAFLSSVWFGRKDVTHLPARTFYPYNGFGGPKRAERDRMFRERDFPPEMFAAHYSNHQWGGRPK